MIIFDLDYFKQINDRCGHQYGDSILKGVSRSVKPLLRTADILGRWGGEEFMVASQHMDLEETMYVAERIRQSIAHIEPQDAPPAVTASLGVATMQSSDLVIDSVIERADRALYDAKAQGRNQVRTLEFLPRAVAH